MDQLGRSRLGSRSEFHEQKQRPDLHRFPRSIMLLLQQRRLTLDSTTCAIPIMNSQGQPIYKLAEHRRIALFQRQIAIPESTWALSSRPKDKSVPVENLRSSQKSRTYCSVKIIDSGDYSVSQRTVIHRAANRATELPRLALTMLPLLFQKVTMPAERSTMKPAVTVR